MRRKNYEKTFKVRVNEIYKFIKENKAVTYKEIRENFAIGKTSLYKYISFLKKKGLIKIVRGVRYNIVIDKDFDLKEVI